MDLFKIIISPRALSQLNEYISYLQYTLMNEQAAESVWKDAMETRAQLVSAAGSLKLCSHPELKRQGYRSIRFIHHRYIMLYRVEEATVYVEAVYHQLQDYENIFADELK